MKRPKNSIGLLNEFMNQQILPVMESCINKIEHKNRTESDLSEGDDKTETVSRNNVKLTP